jgi:hypothetical protein
MRRYLEGSVRDGEVLADIIPVPRGGAAWTLQARRVSGPTLKQANPQASRHDSQGE